MCGILHSHYRKNLIMARTASIILTPAERKAQIVELKDLIRMTVNGIKTIVADQKTAIKARAAADKHFEAQRKADCKQRDGEDKLLAKELATHEKKKATLEAQLSALTNDPAFMPVKKVKTTNNLAVGSSNKMPAKVEQSIPTSGSCDDASADKPKRTRRTKAEMEAFRAGAAA